MVFLIELASLYKYIINEVPDISFSKNGKLKVK